MDANIVVEVPCKLNIMGTTNKFCTSFSWSLLRLEGHAGTVGGLEDDEGAFGLWYVVHQGSGHHHHHHHHPLCLPMSSSTHNYGGGSSWFVYTI